MRFRPLHSVRWYLEFATLTDSWAKGIRQAILIASATVEAGMQDQSDQIVRLEVSDHYGERAIEVRAGRGLLEALQDANVAVASVCGGQMACGTCHVFLQLGAEDPVECPRPSEEEAALLEYSRYYRKDQSRLACQVRVTAALGSSRIVIAPDE